MIHDARMIPLDGRPHIASNVRQLMGDSRGHWEGHTLVVDTTNFSGEFSFRGSDENLHLTERFTRVSPETLLYEFTVDDPTAFSKPWTVQIPVTKTKGPDFRVCLSRRKLRDGGYFGGCTGGREEKPEVEGETPCES